MCVICVKPKGVSQPDKSVFENMFNTNSDGAGFMWVQDDKVHVRKGYMSFDSFWKAWNKHNIKDEWVSIAHFRIGTSGGKTKHMTHPFPISKDPSVLKKTKWDGEIAMAHNGVLGKGETNLSDTAVYVRDILYPLRHHIYDFDNGEFNKDMEDLLKKSIDSSKIVLLNSSGEDMRIGHWLEEDGCYFSNKRWKTVSRSNYHSRNKNYNNSRYRGQDNTYSYLDFADDGYNISEDDDTEYKPDDNDITEIPGEIALNLMKAGIVLRRKPRSRSSQAYETWYRWNDKKDRFERKWSGSNHEKWCEPKTDSFKNNVYLLPETGEEINDIYDAINSYIEENPTHSVTDNYIFKALPNDIAKVENNLMVKYRESSIIERRLEDIKGDIHDMNSIIQLLEGEIKNLEDQRDEVENLLESIDLEKADLYRELYSTNGEYKIAEESMLDFAETLEGTRKPLLETASEFIDEDIDTLDPTCIKNDLHKIGFRVCMSCLKWRAIDGNRTICDKCKE